MKCFDNGCFYTVTVSRPEVCAFRQSFPCSGLPLRAVSFQFNKRNGDLVDMSPSEMDGPGVLALSHDAGNYGARRLGLSDACLR